MVGGAGSDGHGARAPWRQAALPIDVLLLGTGDALRFPAPACLLSLTRAGIGIEVMDTPAACRTYNFLLSEDRRVAAAVLVGQKQAS